MDDQSEFNLNSLRGWQRKQLALLRVFADHIVVPQTMISLASGASQSSSALGGKITPLIRHNLILRAGKDSNGKFVWQLNEENVDRVALKNFLASLDITTHPDTESV